ncbi:MAG: hypothetical protein GKB99_03235 [Methanocellales archaeon]|nr:hypothetical protein [Methanocellales archaeon]
MIKTAGYPLTRKLIWMLLHLFPFLSVQNGGKICIYSRKRDKESKMVKEITNKNEGHFHSENIVEYSSNENINF